MKLLHTFLRLYPREWRARYEEEFLALIEQNRLSPMDVADIALGALDAHLRPQMTAAQAQSERRPFVNRALFTKWSGMAGMVGSVLVLLGFVGLSIFSDNEYPYTYDALDTSANLLFLAGITMTLVFALGFATAYGRQVGVVGQVGLLVVLLGLLSMDFGAIGHMVEMTGKSEGGWWDFFIVGLIGMFLGTAITCLAGITQRVVPAIGSKLAMAGGFAAMATLLLSMGIVPGTSYENMQVFLLTAMLISFIIFMVGLFLLGYALWMEWRAVTRQIEPAPLG